ncbi:MAG: AraC family transcriptional regulator [Clostridia bacterium]|nr:AraC family transcriptional regulator [Clostridia bacterium]
MFTDENLKYKNGEVLPIHCLIDGQDAHSNKAGYGPKLKGELHYHDYIEYIYVLDGKFKVIINDEKFNLEKDDFLIIYSGEPHGFYRNDENSYRYMVLKFLPDLLYTKPYTTNTFNHYINIRDKKSLRIIKSNPELKEHMTKAIMNFESEEYGSDFFLRSNLFSVCAVVLSHMDKNNKELSKSNAITSVQMPVFKLIHELECSIASMSTKDAAIFCGFSPGHFSRIFKSATGMTFHEYTRKLKIEDAQRLLSCTDDSITNIAYSLGYCSSSFFTKEFKAEKGITPMQYRKNLTKI